MIDEATIVTKKKELMKNAVPLHLPLAICKQYLASLSLISMHGCL